MPISWKFRKNCSVIAGGVVAGGTTHRDKKGRKLFLLLSIVIIRQAIRKDHS